MDRIQAIYHLECAPGEVDQISRDIAVEQTVEVPESMIQPGPVADLVGRIEEIRAVAPLPLGGVREVHEVHARVLSTTSFRVRISYDAELSCIRISQLLNLVFEVGPGGHSSLEKHAHTHVIIGVRGRGTLVSGGRQWPVQPFDVAYVPPLSVHQLRNETGEPFGFFCLVDRERDRPAAP